MHPHLAHELAEDDSRDHCLPDPRDDDAVALDRFPQIFELGPADEPTRG